MIQVPSVPQQRENMATDDFIIEDETLVLNNETLNLDNCEIEDETLICD